MSPLDKLFGDSGLPVVEILKELQQALLLRDEAVLEAPPGAGKTTLVPLALLQQPWLSQQKILVLEPRRLAARAAAERMAELLGEKPGATVGYRMRLESRVGAGTRIEVITEGILGRMLQSDPALEGVGLVVFDEFHERSLDADLGLALALAGRELYRDEGRGLKLLVMSATLDAADIAKMLGDAPVLRCSGRSYPVEVRYGEPARLGEPVVERVVNCVASVISQHAEASLLVFLPGEAEIRAVEEALGKRLHGQSGKSHDIVPLYGNLSSAQQKRAIEPLAKGQRKVVLATNIAETSLTIDGISIVVDAGLERAPVFDPSTAMTRLRTQRISRASSVQRMGRAGRLGPGICHRLWSEQQQAQMAEYSSAEIQKADLLPLALQLLAWGVDNPAELHWLDAPPKAAFEQALQLLAGFDAVRSTVGGGCQLSAHGEAMAAMPLHPRLANMLLRAGAMGLGYLGCRLAALLVERNPRAVVGVDLALRFNLLSQGGDIPRQLRGWRKRVQQQEKQYRGALAKDAEEPAIQDEAMATGVLLALAFPDRIARRKAVGVYQLANGRNATLDGSDPLVNSEWLAIAELGGRAGVAKDRIFVATALEPAFFDDLLAAQVLEKENVKWDDQAGRIVAERRRMIGALQLDAAPLDPPATAIHAAQRQMLLQRGINALPWSHQLRQWQARVLLLREHIGEPWPDVSDEALLATIDEWLLPYMGKVYSLAQLEKLDLANLLEQLLPWPLPRQLEELAPQRIEVPSGSSIAIDYGQSPPVLAVKLQEMFGCEITPAIAGNRVALLIHLLSPARRPLQVTQDLAGFWRSSYQEVKKDMKGRYPKHPWPDDPLQALPTGKVKHPRGRRS